MRAKLYGSTPCSNIFFSPKITAKDKKLKNRFCKAGVIRRDRKKQAETGKEGETEIGTDRERQGDTERGGERRGETGRDGERQGETRM